jgi:hypothetical protein
MKKVPVFEVTSAALVLAMTKSQVEKTCKNNRNTALKHHRPGDGRKKD